jgi:hypothetical protein
MMRRLFKHHLLKTLMALIVFTVFIIPVLPFSCQAMMKAVQSGHECCQKKENYAAKLSPCCEACRHAAPRTTLTSSFSVSQELSPVLTSLNFDSTKLRLKSLGSFRTVFTAHSPPLYLSFQTFLC